MITPKFLKHFSLLIRIESKCRFILFEWDAVGDTFLPTRDPWKIFALKAQFFIQLLRSILHAMNFAYDTVFNPNPSLLGKILNFIWFFGHIWGVVIMANNSRDGNDISKLFSELKRIDSKVSGKKFSLIKLPKLIC